VFVFLFVRFVFVTLNACQQFYGKDNLIVRFRAYPTMKLRTPRVPLDKNRISSIVWQQMIAEYSLASPTLYTGVGGGKNLRTVAQFKMKLCAFTPIK